MFLMSEVPLYSRPMHVRQGPPYERFGILCSINPCTPVHAQVQQGTFKQVAATCFYEKIGWSGTEGGHNQLPAYCTSAVKRIRQQ